MDIITNQVNKLTSEFLTATSEEERTVIASKLSVLNELVMSQADLAVTGTLKTAKAKKVYKRKCYDDSEIDGLAYGDLVSFQVVDWKDSKPVENSEENFSGTFEGIKLQANGRNKLNIAFKCTENVKDFEAGNIYCFQPNSIAREYKNHSNK